jgi:hypothetical protein
MADPGPALTRGTVDVALVLYGIAAVLMLRLEGRGWRVETGIGRVARLCWSLACLVYLVHVALAFQYYHGWSHTEAVRHVEAESGFGPGIFVSYLFTLAWTADAAWWGLRPADYARRPGWIGWSLHGFLAFVIFNGSVVYASGPVRWAGVGLFVVLAVCLWWRRTCLADRVDRSGAQPSAVLRTAAKQSGEELDLRGAHR